MESAGAPWALYSPYERSLIRKKTVDFPFFHELESCILLSSPKMHQIWVFYKTPYANEQNSSYTLVEHAHGMLRHIKWRGGSSTLTVYSCYCCFSSLHFFSNCEQGGIFRRLFNHLLAIKTHASDNLHQFLVVNEPRTWGYPLGKRSGPRNPSVYIGLNLRFSCLIKSKNSCCCCCSCSTNFAVAWLVISSKRTIIWPYSRDFKYLVTPSAIANQWVTRSKLSCCQGQQN